jgi:predicted transcriptional regulator
VRFANTRYRILYQRSENLLVLLHTLEKDTGAVPHADIELAAHIRERRYELDLTQHEVARRAGTSHSFISKLENGDHIPTIPVLNRILAVLDEQLLIGIERKSPGDEPEREVAPAPVSMSA